MNGNILRDTNNQSQAAKSKSRYNTILMSDLGTLSITPYFNAKRRQKHDEIKQYERNSILRDTNNRNLSRQSHPV